MELKLSAEKSIDGRKVEIYEIGKYTVRKLIYSDGFSSIDIGRKERADYLPEIYCRDDIEGNILDFEIQTTSYGSLSAEETQKMIAGLEEAVEVVNILTDNFLRKEG